MLNRFTGSLLGLACGDAVGTTLEFEKPNTFKPVTDMLGGGPFNLEIGQWTDDTSMALCLASSLNEHGYNAYDQMTKYVDWMNNGYMSSNGTCFDIGFTTRNALNDFIDLDDPYSGEPSSHQAGNGSLMRLAPVPMYFYDNIDEAIAYSGDSSRTTHGAITCIDACRYYGALIVLALNGNTKEEILSNSIINKYFAKKKYGQKNILCSEILEIAQGSFKIKEPPEIKGTGYVVQSLEAALWAFYKTDNFKDAILHAVNLGDDADTTAAICGQLAGAYYGINGIPKHWLQKLTMNTEIEKIAIELYNS